MMGVGDGAGVEVGAGVSVGITAGDGDGVGGTSVTPKGSIVGVGASTTRPQPDNTKVAVIINVIMRRIQMPETPSE